MAVVIKNGMICTASDIYKADIQINHEKIVQISEKITSSADDQTIDATGLEIYPGAVDVHTHLDMPFMGTVTADDFESGSIAAACGGTTSFIDFIIPSKGQGLGDALEIWHKKAAGKTAVDYGFHIALVEYNERVAAEIPAVIESGITSFKCFLSYKGSLMVDDGEFIKILKLARKHGALVSIHAENGEMVDYLAKELISEGKTAPEFHEAAHPAIAEGEATHRGAALAKMAQVPLYVVHMTCKNALEEIKFALAKGQVVFAETCPQYLLLSNELYKKNGFEAAKWVMSPPLRDSWNNDILWNGIRDGFIKVIATDHCSFNFKGQKEMGLSNFAKIPNGAPGIGDRVNLIYSYGVKKDKISRNKFAEVISTIPAKLFGMYPEKGSIAVGSDADLMFIDPGRKGIISFKTSHYKADYNSYEGFELEGMAVMTISRGKLIAKDNKFLGEKSHGKYVKRRKFDPIQWSVK
ncbi:MAG TPA: dihydropyrimidinase [Candidatus Wallbacteria bacterium]|nr:dihydropyrimidinase [Candidatus Wallbacteria bacterium]